jgi:transposase
MERERKVMIEIRKVYGRKFREQVVHKYFSGAASYTELMQRYGLSSGLLGKWCRRYGGSSEEAEGSRDLQRRVAELERMVGRLTMENDLLKKFAAYTQQQTSERSSIVTARSLRASRRPAGSLGLPEAPITTRAVVPSRLTRTPGSKNG